MQAAWDGKLECVSRDGNWKDDTIQARWKQDEQDVEKCFPLWEEMERNAGVIVLEKQAVTGSE